MIIEQEWIDVERYLQPPLIAGIVGQSRPIKDLQSRIERLATHKGTVLIQGDSGTGKEVVARALHMLGPTSKGPLITFNCSNLVEGLAESQLFGHVKGAFTHAREAYTGCFREANGGTLMLDEIGELPLAMQSKLLRVTELLEVQPVGSAQSYHLDLRIIAATNRELRTMVEKGQFRNDLFYRIDVASVRVPSMRERLDDVPLLVAHFVEHYNRLFGKGIQYISRRALDYLCSYSWPGNVRELAHAIERASLLGEDQRIDVGDLPEDLIARVDSPSGEPTPTPLSSDASHDDEDRRLTEVSSKADTATLDQVLEGAVRRSLEQAAGDCARAAKLLIPEFVVRKWWQSHHNCTENVGGLHEHAQACMIMRWQLSG